MSFNAAAAARYLANMVTDETVTSTLSEMGLKGGNLQTLLIARGVRSQGEFAALVINLTKGGIQAEELTDAMAAAFPGAKVGKRHGPHYLCLARTGKLAGTDIQPPKATRQTVAKMTPKERVSYYQAQLAKAETEAKGGK